MGSIELIVCLHYKTFKMMQIFGFLLAVTSLVVVIILLVKHRKQNKMLKKEIELFKDLNEDL